VTAPPSSPDPQLTTISTWDLPPLRGAVAVLGAVADRLPIWRMRLDAAGRSLGDAQCWSGPAAQSAAAAGLDLSVVVTAVHTSFEESRAALDRLVAEADRAQELAVQAIGGAVESPAALEHSVAATQAARAALDVLPHGLGQDGALPCSFWDLAGMVGLVGPAAAPSVPIRAAPVAVAAWWAGLSAVAQLAVLRAAPGALGGLDGVPAWARDQANRLVLERALADPATPPYAAFTARVVAATLAAKEASGERLQLQLLDLPGDRVVVSVGDLDTAEAVTLLVPGVGTTPGDDLGDQLQSASDVADATRAAAPGLAVAAAVWLGYRTPSGPPGLAFLGAARRGGTALAGSLDGLAAARAASGRPPARTTVLAHSYGTVVVREAARHPGRLAADAVVLLGSPGMAGTAADLEVPEVYDAAALGDPIARLGWFGGEPSASRYGAAELPVGPGMGHSDYYSPDRPTLAALGQVVAGQRNN
jgi:hypothetical protein